MRLCKVLVSLKAKILFKKLMMLQIGIGDIPDMIDYITSRTGQRRMHYIGHSQGTTAFFVMCAERPAYNDRIISAHMLAPIAFMKNLKSPFVRSAAFFLNTLDVIF